MKIKFLNECYIAKFTWPKSLIVKKECQIQRFYSRIEQCVINQIRRKFAEFLQSPRDSELRKTETNYSEFCSGSHETHWKKLRSGKAELISHFTLFDSIVWLREKKTV